MAGKHRLMPMRKAPGWYIQTHIPAFRYSKRFATLIEIITNDPVNGLGKEYVNVAKISKYENDISYGGYVTYGTKTVPDTDITPSVYEAYKTGFERGYDSYFTYFKLFFELAKAEKVHVLIYPFPWPDMASKSDNFKQVYNHYLMKIQALAQNNEYIHFIDYDFYWPNPRFADPLHVNQKGADILSRQAVCWLKTAGITSYPKMPKGFCMASTSSKSFAK
jgi:hypothetical protein